MTNFDILSQEKEEDEKTRIKSQKIAHDPSGLLQKQRRIFLVTEGHRSKKTEATRKNHKTAHQFIVEERRKQVALMAAQGITELEIGKKLGVDCSTVCKDIKALKLISQQFIYDVTKSDFTYYYRQNLELVKMVLRKQWEIASQEGPISEADLRRSKLLTDVLMTRDFEPTLRRC